MGVESTRRFVHQSDNIQDPAGRAVEMFGLSQLDRSRVPYDPATLGLGLGSKFELTYVGLYQNVYGGVGVYSETRETNVL